MVRVVISQSLERGSDEWGYCAWVGELSQKSVSVHKTSEGYEVISSTQPFDSLAKKFPLDTLPQIVDDYIYHGIRNVARRMSSSGEIVDNCDRPSLDSSKV